MSGRFKPCRSLRSEFLTLSVALGVPLALAFAFPMSALKAIPSRPAVVVEPSCAFVTLSPEAERRVVSAARATWQIDRDSARRMRIGLLEERLPPMPVQAVCDERTWKRPAVRGVPSCAPDMMPPTLAAPAPALIAPEPDADGSALPFTRQDMLKLK